jgi:hypothetical protein
MEERVANGRIELPIREMKFDGYTSGFPNQHPDELAGILNDLEEDCFACIS